MAHAHNYKSSTTHFLALSTYLLHHLPPTSFSMSRHNYTHILVSWIVLPFPLAMNLPNYLTYMTPQNQLCIYAYAVSLWVKYTLSSFKGRYAPKLHLFVLRYYTNSTQEDIVAINTIGPTTRRTLCSFQYIWVEKLILLFKSLK